MEIVKTIADMRRRCKAFQRNPTDATIALVPTMGALHEGHLSLVRAAREACNHVAVSLFVNPLQFAPTEDFAEYPQTFKHDCELLEREGVDLLFAPTTQEMYPCDIETWVDVPEIGGRLDGASRPGHFKGVTTVVAKLFNIVQPDKAFFGQKDAAQVAILRTMVRDLNFDLEIVVCPTVRGDGGLALSSRNRFLDADEQAAALVLPRALQRIQLAVSLDITEALTLRNMLIQELESVPGIRLDYADIVDPNTLKSIDDVHGGALVAVAAWAGETRLIDNLLIPQHTEQSQ
jgi:pantoate--beta-alanine ligase